MRAALLALALLLAGCAAPPASEPQRPRAQLPPGPGVLEAAWLDAALPSEPLPFDALRDAGLALKASPRARLSLEGHSGEGRPLLGVLLSEGEPGGKPTVMMTASQHGDEPAGSDAALLLARYYAWGGDAALRELEQLNVFLLLCANPDGRAAGTRTDARGRDVDRDHMNLATPEARAVHDASGREAPAVVLDLHEFGGRLDAPAGGDPADHFEVGAPQDPFVYPGIAAASAQLAGQVAAAVDAAFGPGTAFVYAPTGSSQGGSIHRNHYAVHGSLSLLFEADGGLADYRQQVRLHVVAAREVIARVAAQPDTFSAARAEALHEAPPAALRGWLLPPHPALANATALLRAHGLQASLAPEDFAATGIAPEQAGPAAVRVRFPSGTLVVPSAQPAWRAAMELLTASRDLDADYTDGPRDAGVAVYEELASGAPQAHAGTAPYASEPPLSTGTRPSPRAAMP
jgi:hypothetical protein